LAEFLPLNFTAIIAISMMKDYSPYYKIKLELKSNLSEILQVNRTFICDHVFLFCVESQT